MPQQFPAIRLVALDLDGTLLNREWVKDPVLP